jgi:hypothetical protein
VVKVVVLTVVKVVVLLTVVKVVEGDVVPLRRAGSGHKVKVEELSQAWL